MRSGSLYLVATPIGNLEDISLRSLRVLKQVAQIACEDTRQTRKLLGHYGIATPTLPFHRFNEHRILPGLLKKLLSGEDLALVTDGGTPSISDPGFSLVRAAVEKGAPVVPVPGPSAPLAALIASGLPADRFVFLGFLPHRSGERKRFLLALGDRTETMVFFDSPRRVGRSLQEMAAIFGDRRAAICREMTKIHEEFLRGSLEILAKEAGERTMKGEITLVVEGTAEGQVRPQGEVDLCRAVSEAMVRYGLSRRDAVRDVARRCGIPRREVYRVARAVKQKASGDASSSEE